MFSRKLPIVLFLAAISTRAQSPVEGVVNDGSHKAVAGAQITLR